MTTHNLKVLFVQAKNRTNKKNVATLYRRFTLNGNRKQFSTGIQIETKHWDNKTQTILKSHNYALLYNSLLENIKSKISNIYIILELQGDSFSIDDFQDKYLYNHQPILYCSNKLSNHYLL